ncbi:MAG TPA: portal protein, partial [Verrucomicrobiota bacterium]|nr:portal protein [Verrucomicrobiota bacterium]
MTAKTRYDVLSGARSQYLKVAEDASKLTIPYLIHQDDNSSGARKLVTPWQGVGAKGVVTLASKLMLALLPP